MNAQFISLYLHSCCKELFTCFAFLLIAMTGVYAQDGCCLVGNHGGQQTSQFSVTSNPSQYLLDVYASPTIVATGAEFKIKMKLNSASFDSVKIEQHLGWLTLLDSNIVTQLVFYDDGTRGDEVAGDSLYTSGGLIYVGNGGGLGLSAQIFYRYVDVEFYENNSFISENLDLATSIGVYDPAIVPVPTLTKVNDTVQYGTYTINVVRKAKWSENPFPVLDYWRTSGLFQEMFCDSFMYLVQNTTNNMKAFGGGARFGPSTNSTYGIGKGINNLNLPFIGLITMGWSRFTYSPAFEHEMLHKWAAVQDLYGSTSQGQGITGYGHWGWVNYPTSGLYGPTSFEFCELEKLGGDTVKIHRQYGPGRYCDYQVQNLNKWNELELYLAGLIPIDSIDWPIIYLKDVELITPLLTDTIIATATIDTVTMADWLDVVGPRIPAQGPTEYSVVQVVFSDELLTAQEMSYFDYGVEIQMQENIAPNTKTNIFHSTGGRVHLTNGLRQKLFAQYDTICVDETHPSGYTMSGVYTDTFPRAQGCDSIVSLHLTVVPDSCFCNLEVFMAEEFGDGSLNDVLDCAESGDTVVFASAVNGDTITIQQSTIHFDKNLFLKAIPSQNIWIDGSSLGTLFTISNQGQVRIEGLNIIAPALTPNDVINNEGVTTLKDVNVYEANGVTKGIVLKNSGELNILGVSNIKHDE